MKNFKGKVAVVTGAGRGIGRGIAMRCAQEGMKIVLAGIGMESLSRTEAELRAMGAETLIVQTDVSLLEKVENLAEKSYEAFGVVDLLVNNAGVNVPVSVLDSSMDDWNWIMGVNFYGMLFGVKTFLPRMIQQNSTSHVVNVSSVAGVITGGGGGGAPYGVSKHAVLVLTEALYLELPHVAPHVGVSVLCPGYVNSEIYASERSRPDRFKTHATRQSDKQRAQRKASLAQGYSIEKVAEVLFSGVREGKLYIGPKEFQDQVPYVAKDVRARAENILNGKNPEVP